MLLEMKDAVKQFGGITALSHMSFQVEEGEIFGIIGPNGAGKTTIFNLITGVYQVTSGDIVFNGSSLKGKKTYQIVQNGIARTFQNIRLFSGMTALENVLVGHNDKMKSGLLSGVFHTGAQRKEEKEAREKAMELLRFVGLAEDADKPATELPYGKQRKLEIARAMASEPKLILLDEPVLGFDAIMRVEFYDMLTESFQKHPRIIIVSTHIIEEIAKTIQKLIIIDRGKVCFFDTLQAVETKAFSISGLQKDVEVAVRDRNVIGQDTVGGLATSYIFDNPPEQTASLEIRTLSLQDFFIQMVGHKGGALR